MSNIIDLPGNLVYLPNVRKAEGKRRYHLLRSRKMESYYADCIVPTSYKSRSDVRRFVEHVFLQEVRFHGAANIPQVHVVPYHTILPETQPFPER